jgi:hypothetical protein
MIELQATRKLKFLEHQKVRERLHEAAPSRLEEGEEDQYDKILVCGVLTVMASFINRVRRVLGSKVNCMCAGVMFLTTELDREGCTVKLALGERATGSHWTVWWVRPQGSLDTVMKRMSVPDI